MIRGAQCHIELGFLRAQPASLPLLIPTAEHRDAVFRLVARQRGRLGQDLGQPVEREIKRLLVPALGTWQRPWHELAGHTGGQTVLGQAALLSRLLAGENARRDRAVAVHQSAFGVLRFRPFRNAPQFSTRPDSGERLFPLDRSASRSSTIPWLSSSSGSDPPARR